MAGGDGCCRRGGRLTHVAYRHRRHPRGAWGSPFMLTWGGRGGRHRRRGRGGRLTHVACCRPRGAWGSPFTSTWGGHGGRRRCRGRGGGSSSSSTWRSSHPCGMLLSSSSTWRVGVAVYVDMAWQGVLVDVGDVALAFCWLHGGWSAGAGKGTAGYSPGVLVTVLRYWPSRQREVW